MITVHFNDVGEFIDELKAGPPGEKIVRVTRSFAQSQTLPITNVTILATALRDGQIIRLSRYVGQYLGSHDGDEKRHVDTRAEKIMAEIEGAAKELGLEVRAGVYE
jgi:hypothetical protein